MESAEESTDDESFDPYLRWLGIRDPERPVSHYRLLGIDFRESDPDVIATAADRQMSHVRRYQTGRYAQQSQELLNELASARLVLLDPSRRAEYDRRHQIGVSKDNEGDSSRVRYFVAAGFLLFVTVCGLWMNRDRFRKVTIPDEVVKAQPVNPQNAAQEKTSAQNEAESSGDAELPSKIERPDGAPSDVDEAPNGLIAVDSSSEGETDANSETVGDASGEGGAEPKTVGQSPEALAPEFVEFEFPITPVPVPKNGSIWADIKQAISERDVDSAVSELIDADSVVETTADAENYEALSEILEGSKQFWLAVEQAFEGAVPVGTFLKYGDMSPVQVVSIGKQGLVLAAPDRSQVEYPAVPTRLPPLVAAGLVEHVLPNSAETHFLLGVFWAFDQRGSFDQAKQHWRYVRDEERWQKLVKVWRSSVEARVRQDLATPPSAKEYNQLSRRIEKRLKVQRERPDPTAADRLAEEAGRSVQGSALRYACLCRAAHYAAMAGRAEFALKMLRDVQDEYAGNLDQQRIDVLGLLLRNVSGESVPTIARSAIISTTHSIESDDYVEAEAFAKIALRAARRTEDEAAVDQAAALISKSKVLRRAYQPVLRAQQELEGDSDNAAANRVVGEFYCFRKGDFAGGLPFLSKSDSSQSQLARETIRVLGRASTAPNALSPSSIGPGSELSDVLDVADRWWQAAMEMGKFERQVVQGYVRTLYRGLLGKLRGETKKRVLSRLNLGGEPSPKP